MLFIHIFSLYEMQLLANQHACNHYSEEAGFTVKLHRSGVKELKKTK